MVKTSSLLIFTIVALAQSPVKTTDKSADLLTGLEVLDSGVTISSRINYEPWPPRNWAFDKAVMGFDPTGGDTVRRYICDLDALSCFGFDMTVSGTPTDESLQVSFGPLTVSETVRESLDASAHGRPLSFAKLPKYPPPQTVHIGDTIALDLMISADGRERIVAYFKFIRAPQAHDASIDDASFITLDLRGGPEVRVNGRTAIKQASFSQTPTGGSTLWLYVPGEGRYILSPAPHDGFEKAGTIRGGIVAFRANGQDYEIRGLSVSALILRDEIFNLYVIRDSAWLPATGATDSMMGGIDRIENLLPHQ
jgi:hypothetical protein